MKHINQYQETTQNKIIHHLTQNYKIKISLNKRLKHFDNINTHKTKDISNIPPKQAKQTKKIT